jgi:hypothetical protein
MLFPKTITKKEVNVIYRYIFVSVCVCLCLLNYLHFSGEINVCYTNLVTISKSLIEDFVERANLIHPQLTAQRQKFTNQDRL